MSPSMRIADLEKQLAEERAKQEVAEREKNNMRAEEQHRKRAFSERVEAAEKRADELQALVDAATGFAFGYAGSEDDYLLHAAYVDRLEPVDGPTTWDVYDPDGEEESFATRDEAVRRARELAAKEKT